MFDEEEMIYEENSSAIGRCTECGELVYDDSCEIYVDDEGNYFCGLECALNYYGIRQAEDCLV